MYEHDIRNELKQTYFHQISYPFQNVLLVYMYVFSLQVTNVNTKKKRVRKLPRKFAGGKVTVAINGQWINFHTGKLVN